MTASIGEQQNTFIETITNNIWLAGSCLQSYATSFFKGLYYIFCCGCSEHTYTKDSVLPLVPLEVFRSAHGATSTSNPAISNVSSERSMIPNSPEHVIVQLEVEKVLDEQCADVNGVGIAGKYITLDTHRPELEPGVCSSGLVYLECLPTIGHYDPSGYEFADPMLTVRLPIAQLSRFPAEIQNRYGSLGRDQLDLFFVVFDGTDLSTVSRNVIIHPLAFPDVLFNSTANGNFEMGICSPRGVVREESSDGLNVDSFCSMNVHVHPQGDSMAISPDNARFNIDPGCDISSFYFASDLPGYRGVAFMALMVNRDSAGMRSALDCSGNITEFVENVAPHLDETEIDRIRQMLMFASADG